MFRRLGVPLGDFNSLNRFGSGQHEGYKWDRILNFEKGVILDNPTGFDSLAGAGTAQLTVEAAAAIRGNWGYQINITDVNARYGNIGFSLTQMQLEFLFDVNSLTMANADIFDIMRFSGGFGVGIFIQLQYLAASGYAVRFIARNDAAANRVGAFITVPDEACQVRIQWKASDFAGADNGLCRLFVNNERSADNFESLDNDTHVLTGGLIGAVGGLDAGTSGPFFMDNLRYSSQFNS